MIDKILDKLELFVDALDYMGQGMLVIFVIIGVIILATIATNKLFSREKEDEK